MSSSRPSDVGYTPVIHHGITGNVYVYCKDQSEVEKIAEAIGRSKKGVYYNHIYRCFALRVKSKKHKQRLKEFEVYVDE